MKGMFIAASAALVLPVLPAQAADEPVSFPVGSGTLTVIAPEVKWSQPGGACEDFPLTYRWAFDPSAVAWWRLQGQVQTVSGAIGDYVSLQGTDPGTVTDSVRLCPEVVGHGSMRLVAQAWTSAASAVPVSVPFTLTRMRTRLRITKIAGDARRTTVRGKVRAYHPRVGWQPGEGTVRVQFRKPGGRWRGFGTTLASGGSYKGRFEWTRYRVLPKRTKYRATFVENAKQDPAVSAVRRG